MKSSYMICTTWKSVQPVCCLWDKIGDKIAKIKIAASRHSVNANDFLCVLVCWCRSATGSTGTAVVSHLIQQNCAWRTCCTTSVAMPRACCWFTSWYVMHSTALMSFQLGRQWSFFFLRLCQNNECPEGLRGVFCLFAVTAVKTNELFWVKGQVYWSVLDSYKEKKRKYFLSCQTKILFYFQTLKVTVFLIVKSLFIISERTRQIKSFHASTWERIYI